MKISPLGRYAAITSAIICVAIVLAVIASHLIGKPDGLLDSAFLIVVGLTVGGAGGLTLLNGTVQRTSEQDDIITGLQNQINTLHEKVAKGDLGGSSDGAPK